VKKEQSIARPRPLILLCIFYAVNLYYFYYVVVWKCSENIAQACRGYFKCYRHFRVNEFGWQVDWADGQWRSFRQNLRLLGAVACGTVLITHFIRSWAPQSSLSTWRLSVGLIMVFLLHGLHGFIVFGLSLLGFYMAQIVGGTVLGPFMIWLTGIFILCFKESYRILHWKEFSWLGIFFDRQYGGIYGWQLPANFLVLRIISYGMDLHWQRKEIATAKGEVKARVIAEKFDFGHYLSYIFYAPLYMAGPIVTYSELIEYDYEVQNKESIFPYSLRFLLCLGLLEYMTAKFPFFAVMQSGLLPHLRTEDVAVVFYMLLKLMWMKFLVMWRFFRLWALADGVYVEENMKRCMTNNYSLEAFWRGWHVSFNKWIIKYMYKPLGGRAYRFINVWFVFLFVALWHDVEWKLVLWALLNCAFLMLEGGMKMIYKKVFGSRDTAITHVVAAISGGVYVFVLMVINLVGYAIGAGTFDLLVDKMASEEGFRTFILCFYFSSVGVSIMLTLRKYKLCSD
jgi:D-alanyl-lipoteichoic acid acyltransferase DltB (MBOAT superfamily)